MKYIYESTNSTESEIDRISKIEAERAKAIKQNIIKYLINEGYGTYAKRFSACDLVIADMVGKMHVNTALMRPFADKKTVYINPSFVDIAKMYVAGDNRDNYKKLMDQLSVLVRHELLHYLLVHQRRLAEHLAKTDPTLADIYTKDSIQLIANKAADYEISEEGYDNHDLEIVRLMTLNNSVIGGLIREDDHPEWNYKTMEEMFDILKEEHKQNLSYKPKLTVNIHKDDSHSSEYKDIYNQVIKDFQNLSDAEINVLLKDASNNLRVINPVTGEIIIDAGE